MSRSDGSVASFDSPVAPAAGAGRGVSQTRPAWMTSGTVAGTLQSKPSPVVAPSSPSPDMVEEEAPPTPAGQRTLAVCLLTIDMVRFEDVWKKWASQCPEGWRVDFHIHAKHPDRVRKPSWTADHLLSKTFNPEWGSIELVFAMRGVFEAALKHGSTEFMVLASESCLPAVPVAKAIELLEDSGGKSWAQVNIAITERNEVKFKSIAAAGDLDFLKLCRCDQWVALTREHAQLVLDLPTKLDKDLDRAFKTVVAPDEIYVPSCLSLAGVVNLDYEHAMEKKRKQDATRQQLYNLPPAKGPKIKRMEDGVLRRRLAYCEWASRSAKSPSALELTATVVAAAQAEGCITMRKFKPGSVSVGLWSRLVLGEAAGGGADVAAEGGGDAPARVPVASLGLKPKPVLSKEELKDKALADAAKYFWEKRDWRGLGRSHRNLVVVCAGDGWLDLTGREWLTMPQRPFEVHVIYYGSTPSVLEELQSLAGAVFEDQGPKWNLLTRYFKFVPWFQCDFLWLPDDDMLIDGAGVANVFSFVRSQNLQLAQPAIVRDDIGVGSHPIHQQVDGLAFRLINFVECQAPLFHRDLLMKVVGHFDRLQPATGFGIDSVWSHIAADLNCRIGVIDQFPMKHTKPYGIPLNRGSEEPTVPADSYFVKLDLNPFKECHAICVKFGRPELRNHTVKHSITQEDVERRAAQRSERRGRHDDRRRYDERPRYGDRPRYNDRPRYSGHRSRSPPRRAPSPRGRDRDRDYR